MIILTHFFANQIDDLERKGNRCDSWIDASGAELEDLGPISSYTDYISSDSGNQVRPDATRSFLNVPDNSRRGSPGRRRRGRVRKGGFSSCQASLLVRGFTQRLK